MPSALNTIPEGLATHLSCPSAQPLDTPLSSPLKRNKLAPLGAVSKQGNLLSVFVAPYCSKAPIKPCLNFFSGL